jgi:hypothetical protein
LPITSRARSRKSPTIDNLKKRRPATAALPSARVRAARRRRDDDEWPPALTGSEAAPS